MGDRGGVERSSSDRGHFERGQLERGQPDRGKAVEIEWDPQAEVRCVHVRECGACPLMPRRYEDQRAAKMARLRKATDRYAITPDHGFGAVDDAPSITGYRRRAKLVVAREPGGDVAVGLYRRHDNQSVIDIPHCQVLSPALMELTAELRELASAPPPELACLLEPSTGDSGVFAGLDARELLPPHHGGDTPHLGEGHPGKGDEEEEGSDKNILLTIILAAERAKSVDEMREAARALRRRFPQISGLAVSLRYSSRQQASTEFISLSGASEGKDEVGGGYQLVSHTSFLHVHRGQADRLYELLVKLCSGAGPRVLDLYGGTGAIALTLARHGQEAGQPLQATLVESYPPAAALALRAAQAQRLPVEVITGDVASVAKALAAAGSRFDVVIANPPRRGLSPAARESVAALTPAKIVYVACDLDNLCRDADHLSRLGYKLT
jgi:23S rRNA (uracil1939-C5)-methyltransferase